MPELPEVETIVVGLRAGLVGRTVRSVEVVKPLVVKSPVSAFVSAWVERRIEKIERHGKAIFFHLSLGSERSFVRAHLGMTGQMLLRPENSPADAHTRILFRFNDTKGDLHYRDVRQFGRWNLVSEAHEAGWGPDAWTSSNDILFRRLRDKNGMLKHALLSQQVLAGLGNIYVDESLHATKLHPRQRLERVSDEKLRELCVAIKAVLKRSIELGGTSFRNYVDTKGGTGGFKGRLKVYGKEGKPCRGCGTPVKRIVVASRGTHFCPGCQRAPRARRGVIR